MKTSSNSIGRRDFLACSVSAAGAGAFGLVPRFAASEHASVVGPKLYYWNGTAFIPGSVATPTPIASDSVEVTIQSFGASPSVAAIDVEIVGGRFCAFTAPPRGAPMCRFRVPVAPPVGLTLIVHSESGSTTFCLASGATVGSSLRLGYGTYLLLDSAVSADRFEFMPCSDEPLTYADGIAVSIPYNLISIGD